MNLLLTQEQLDSLLREYFLGGALLMFCLWVAARVIGKFWSRPQLNVDFEALKKRGSE